MNTKTATLDDSRSLDQLSAREREVLCHLALHKTSKQIGRDLDLSETTVNKAIFGAREKWDARDRREAAQIYEYLICREDGTEPADGDGAGEGYRNYTHQFLYRDSIPEGIADEFPDLPRDADFWFSDSLALARDEYPEVPAPMGLEALDRRFGKAWRVLAVPLLALVIAMVLVCVAAIAWMSSHIA